MLDYSSQSKCFVRSILGGELYGFAVGSDRAFVLRHDLQTIYKMNISLQILRDSLKMLDVIAKARYTTERRSMIDIAAAREALNREDISNFWLVSSEYNVAEAFTKRNPQQSIGYYPNWSR